MNRAYWLRRGELIEGALDGFFPFLAERGHVIALVGAGGKTTLMYELARLLCARGQKVAVTTTTRILRPKHCEPCRALDECRERWARGAYAVWGSDLGNGKLGALDAADFDRLLAHADALLVEADGARRMACKAPAAHEPVIPPEADTVIGVMGLDALGQTIEAACFRPEEVAALLGRDIKHILTPADLAAILRSEDGTFKDVGKRTYYAALNKCDDDARRDQGAQILRLLGDGAVMTHFAKEFQR